MRHLFRWLRAAIARRTLDPFRAERLEMRRIYGGK